MKKKIFLIEDESVFLKILTSKLEHAGYDVMYASQEKEALTKYKATKPDLIVLDIMLTDVDGYDILKKFRKDGGKIPVLVLTNVDTEKSRIKGEEMGVNMYMIKSETSLDDVLKNIKQALQE